MRPNQISIGIVDDHTLFRDGLSTLLKEQSKFSVLFSANNGKEMQEKISILGTPEIILMDINMPLVDGAEATEWLQINHPGTFVIALSMYEDEFSIIKMLRKGARGYITKESNVSEVCTALETISSTGYYSNELVSGRLMRSFVDGTGKAIDIVTKLTEREKEFLTHICSELTYKEIADLMGVSPRTVDGYRDLLFEKLNLKSRTGLVLFAIREKLFML